MKKELGKREKKVTQNADMRERELKKERNKWRRW